MVFQCVGLVRLACEKLHMGPDGDAVEAVAVLASVGR